VAQIQGDSPQAVAYALLENIARLEGKSLNDPEKGANRQYVIDTYKECLSAAFDIRRWGPYGT
jgi:hypothetical protein